MNYYDAISAGYDDLHKEEQLRKLAVIAGEDIIQEGDVLLDVGCGTGYSLDYFAVREAHGIDPAAKLVEQYSGNGTATVGAAESIDYADDVFDVVISLTALQNFTDLRLGLEEIKRVGKNRFVLTTLKRSKVVFELEKLLPVVFSGYAVKKVEEFLDFIYFISC